MKNTTERESLIRSLRQKNNVVRLMGDIDGILWKSGHGDAVMQYAYARINDCLHPYEDSINVMKEYYMKAMEGGIADARAFLALALRDGDFGEADVERYHEELRKALAEGSEKAAQQIFRDRIFGSYGVAPDPRSAYEEIERLIMDATANGEEADPLYYHLLADADIQLGRTGNALSNYEKAARSGDTSAFFWLALYSSCDEKGEIVDKDEFARIMEEAREADAPESYLTYAMLLERDFFDALSEEEKKRVSKRLEDDLETALSLGEDTAAWYLGNHLEDGAFGFPKDLDAAFHHYLRGADLRNTWCCEAVARMILEDRTAPEGYDEAFAYEYAYKSLLLGSDEALDIVISGYRNGYLADHSKAIEQIYMPRYGELAGEYMDDHEIDEDDWGMDPDIEFELDTCYECLYGASERIHNREKEWEVAGIVRKFLYHAERIKESGLMLENLYETSGEIEEYIFDHPRLKLKVKVLREEILSILSETHEIAPETVESLRDEIIALDHSILLADEGRLDEIPKSGYLKKDPVEWTKEWEEHIDEADRIAYGKLEGVPRGMGFCFDFWAERRIALAAFGIEWRNPHIMNPRVMFD